MKKIIVLLIAIAMMLSLAACGGDNPEETKPQQAETQQTENQNGTTQTEAVEEENPLSYTFTQYGNAKITILGAEFIKDDWDEDVLRIYYDYTNTSDTACYQYPALAVDFKSITQNGEKVNSVFFGSDDDCAIEEDLNYDSPVQPGLTSRQTMLIECDPNGGIVEVSCYVMIGNWMYEEDKVECFTFQIDPRDLPDVPEPLKLAPIMNPTYAAGLPASGTNENGQISIDGMELTVGDAGENVLRVKLTVTNNGEEADMPMSITHGVEVYQDGFALPWFSTWHMEDPTDADNAYEEDLEPGETVQCNALFRLRNDHPVEIVIEDLYSEVRLGMIGDVKAAMEALQAALDAQRQAADAASAEARKALVGTWLQRDSDWEDTYIFYADGSGLLISGPEYPFTYSVNGNILTLTYDEDDEEEFTITVSGTLLTMVDLFDDEYLLDKQTEEPEAEVTEETTEPTEATEATQAEISLAEFIIGTWEDQETDYHETFTFNKDGTGLYSYTDGGVWEFGFTYEVCEDDSVDILFDDGDVGGFWITISDDNTILITNYGVTDMPLVRK